MGVKTLRIMVTLTSALALQKFLVSEIQFWDKIIRENNIAN